jgi:site-specific DNA recombinase
MNLDQLAIQNSKAFSSKKVTVDQAHKILNRNHIQVDKIQAKEILDFLYLIAKTYDLKEIDLHASDKP